MTDTIPRPSLPHTLPLRTALMLMMSACIAVYVHAHTANHSTFITMVVPHVTKMQITELHATESPRNERPSVLPLPLAEVGALTCYERSEAASQMKKDGVRNLSLALRFQSRRPALTCVTSLR